MAVIGRHVLVDVWGADPDRINDKKEVLAALQSACEEAGATILHSWYHSFEPQGVTALVGLAESHASIHTYPEFGYYAADIFTCGDLDPRKAMASLVRKLGGRGQGWFIERGGWKEPVRFAETAQ
jgi:S-adenosylmethionine decarboxylase